MKFPRRVALILFGLFIISTVGSTRAHAATADVASSSYLPLSIGGTTETQPIQISEPVRLIIPSIGLDTSIIGVGLNNKGEMAVPSGKTQNVGWYKYGVMPGNTGSAVIDAHVFAAFSQLKNVPVGSDVYIVTNSGQKLHFVVSNAQTFALKNLSSDTLFASTNDKDLNLITCAGSLTADHSTYDHRLIVFTTFAGIVS